MKIIITVDGGRSGKAFLESLGYNDIVIEKKNDWAGDLVGEFTKTGSELDKFIKTILINKIIGNQIVYSVEMINDA